MRRVLRWAPAAVLALALALCWTLLYTGGMRAVVAWIMLISIGQILGPLALIAVAVHAIRKRRFSPPMQAAAALAAFSLWPALWGFGILPIAFPASIATSRPDATVRVPLDGPVRVGQGGDRLAGNYHAMSPDQRWAYDLVVDPAFGGSARLEDYGCYGKTVVAPIAGRVRFALDGEPDQVPGTVSMNFQKPLGNSVGIELASGTYLVLAHLKPGSVKVHEGDSVTEGQPIGACGNSGNTSEPHVHIHHQRQDPKDRGLNLSEGLPLFFRDHDGPPMPEGGDAATVITHRGKAAAK
ncbi:MAG: M23 family metallopeptidase [Bryobacteraceae bacterium]